MGLYICKKLAKRLHGNIKIQSSLNQGSEFSLTINMKNLLLRQEMICVDSRNPKSNYETKLIISNNNYEEQKEIPLAIIEQKVIEKE